MRVGVKLLQNFPGLILFDLYFLIALVPDGKPTVTMAYNMSSTSIHISWRAPHKSTIHGEFLGYRISYRPREKPDDEVKEIYIRDSNVDVSEFII